MALANQQTKAIYTDFEGRIGVWSGTVVPTSYSDFVNFEKIEITTPQQEKVKLISRMTSSLGSALDSQSVPTDDVAQVAIEFSTMTPSMIASALGATVTEVVESGSSVAAEAVTTILNEWVKLANVGISSLTLDIGGAVAGTKFEVDTELGMIKAIHADAVGTGTVDYTVDARTWEQYLAGLATSSYVHITGQAKEAITEKVGLIDIWRANLVPDGSFDVVGGQHLKGMLSGDLIVPTTSIYGAVQTTPWRWLLRTA